MEIDNVIKVAKYGIIIEKAEDSCSAYCPDLPGIVATARTVEDTIRKMKDAIKFHLKGLRERNLAIPEPATEVTYIEVSV